MAVFAESATQYSADRRSVPEIHQRKGSVMATNALVKAGAVFFVLWGLLHIAVGLSTAGQFLTSGLATVMLGVADGAFIIALMLPGFISPAAGGLGPLLYVLGVASTLVATGVVPAGVWR